MDYGGPPDGSFFRIMGKSFGEACFVEVCDGGAEPQFEVMNFPARAPAGSVQRMKKKVADQRLKAKAVALS